MYRCVVVEVVAEEDRDVKVMLATVKEDMICCVWSGIFLLCSRL